MPEVAIAEPTPDEIVNIQLAPTEEMEETKSLNPLLPFILLLPFIYLGGMTLMLLGELIKWGFNQLSDSPNS